MSTTASLFSLVVALSLPEVRKRRMVKGFDFIFPLLRRASAFHNSGIHPTVCEGTQTVSQPSLSKRAVGSGSLPWIAAVIRWTQDHANRDVPSDASPILWAATPSCRRYQTRLVVELVLGVVGALARCGAGRLRRSHYLRLCRWMCPGCWIPNAQCFLGGNADDGRV